jgi:S-adenosylmethionine decarboxylase proenzyme
MISTEILEDTFVLGSHFLVELSSCEHQLINDAAWVREVMLKAAQMSEAQVIGDMIHKFSPQGVSGVVVIAESHISIHTWPERGLAAIDFFTCSKNLKVTEALDFIKKSLGAKQMNSRCVHRAI